MRTIRRHAPPVLNSRATSIRMDQDSNESVRRVLWPVKTEAATVIAEMRQNAKWASNRPAMLYMQDPAWALLYNLQQLRMSHHSTLQNSEPLQFLQPFLDIITSAEASGPVTGAALVSVRKLLHSSVLSHFPASSVARAMHAVVVALGGCKFEATNPWHDQAVLTRILQTLEACIACPSGRLLSNTDACAVFQAVYRIGFDTQVVQELSELLVNLVKESLLTMVRIMFAHAARSSTTAQVTSANASGTSLYTGGLIGVADSTNSLHAQDSYAESTDRLTARSTHDRAGSMSRSSSHRIAAPTAESLDESVPLSIPGGKYDKGAEGYGQPAAGHILQFLIKLARVEPMRVFALDLIQEGVAAGGSALLQMPSILRRLQVELLDSMLATFRGDARVDVATPRALPDALMRMTHLVLTLYVSLRRNFLLQAELFIQAILLPLAKGTLMPDSRGSTPQVLSEAAQECLADLAVFPGFLQEVYASLDCRVECSNLFEDMCQVIAQRTHPSAHTGRSVASALALKSATAVLHSVIDAESLPESISVPPACLFTSKARSDLWHAVSRGEEPTCEGLMAQLNQGTEAEEVGGNAWRELCGVRRVQWEKFLKTKLEDAIKLFNEDYRKGFQMMQVSHILPDPMDSRSVASLLRFARGIDRQIVGNFMGKGESFNQEVMAEYVRTFPFDRLSFDAGFRAFADTFKQPPESQQVVRFTKNFVQAFLEAHNGDYRGFRTMKSLDDFMTVCLWHNSTWYNSNPKVPKMRDVPQFRATMEESLSDHDTPDEAIFSEMYHSICTTAFPQGTNEQFKADMPLARLSLTAQRSDTARGQVHNPSRFHAALHRDMFSLCWGPLVRAVAALLEAAQPEETHIITDGMAAMRAAAAAAKACHAEGVVDAILQTLAQFTMPADPGVSYPRAVVEFGSSLLAREATLTLFSIASEYADQLRGGWATCLACVLRLHQLRLVDASVFSDAQGDEGMPLAQRSNGQRREPESMNLLGFFFAPPPPTELSPEERRFQEGAKETVAQCRIGALFDDSKFLATPALHELVRAVAAAASPRSSSQDGSLRDDSETAEFERFYSGGLHDSYGGKGAGEAVDLEVAEACLELLMKIAIRNRDRIQVVLPVLKEQVVRCVRGATPGAVVLTQRAVVGLLRVCTRLLMYRSDVTDDLVDCIKVVQNLNLSPSGERHVHQLAPSIARSLLALMSACCDQIDSPAAWEVLLSLLESTTSHPDSVLPVHAALDTICRDGRGMCAANYMHVVTAVRALVVSACSAWMSAEQAREAGREAALPFDDSQIRGSVDLLELVANWLQTWRQRQAQASALPDSNENEMQRRRWLAELATYWHHLLRAVAYTCVEPLAPVRDHALVVMHRCMDVAGEHLKLPHETWGSTWRDIILPMLADLAGRMQEVSGMSAAGNMRRAGMEFEEKAVAHSMCIMINIVHKTFVARVAELSRLRDWRGLWLSTLQGLKMCTSTTEAAATADVRGAVVQAMGGMIHTLHARKLLWANSRDREGLNMWDRTFAAAMEVSPELSPESLGVLA